MDLFGSEIIFLSHQKLASGVCDILLIGGRPIGRVGLSAIFASALALAACHLPGSPIHAQLGYAEHREPREDQG